MTDISIREKLHKVLDEILDSPKVHLQKDTTGKLNFTVNLNTGGVTSKTFEMNMSAVINA